MRRLHEAARSDTDLLQARADPREGRHWHRRRGTYVRHLRAARKFHHGRLERRSRHRRRNPAQMERDRDHASVRREDPFRTLAAAALLERLLASSATTALALDATTALALSPATLALIAALGL